MNKKKRESYPPFEESLAEVYDMMDAQEAPRTKPPGSFLGPAMIRQAVEEFAELTYEDQATRLVYWYVRDHLDPSDEKYDTFNLDEVYVVSFSYVLGNWRAMVSTTLPDGMYYEVTYIRELGTAYVDAYKRSGHKELTTWPREINSAGEEQAAKRLVVRDIVDEILDGGYPLKTIAVHLLWFTHIRRTWKAFLVSNADGEIRYEVTFDGAKTVAYIDTYKWFETVPIPIPSREGDSSERASTGKNSSLLPECFQD